MMTGDDLRTARMKAGLTQQEIADSLGVSMRSVGNWERSVGRLPRAREQQVRDLLGQVGREESPLMSASDMALLAELGRRLDRARQQEDETDGSADEKSSGGYVPQVTTDQEIAVTYADRGTESRPDASPTSPQSARGKRR